MWRQIVSFGTGRSLWIAALAVLAVKFILPIGSGGLATIIDSVDELDTAAIVELTNQERVAVSRSPLTYSVALETAAYEKLRDMARQNYFAHESPTGELPWDFIAATGYRYGIAGENLARGFHDPKQVVAALMSSPTHQANIVHTEYSETGIASGRIILNGKPATVVVQLFASPRGHTSSGFMSSQNAGEEGTAVAGAQAISSDITLSHVMEPSAVVLQPSGTAGAVATHASGVLAIVLTAMIGVLAVAGVSGRYPGALRAAAIHAIVLGALTVLPSLPSGHGVIF